MEKDDERMKDLLRQVSLAQGPYSAVNEKSSDGSIIKVRIEADGDPILPSKVLSLITIRGQMPLKFSLTFDPNLEMSELFLEVSACSLLYPDLLLDQLMKFPSVREAALLS